MAYPGYPPPGGPGYGPPPAGGPVSERENESWGRDLGRRGVGEEKGGLMGRDKCVVTRIACLEGASETNLESRVDLVIKTRQGRATTLEDN